MTPGGFGDGRIAESSVIPSGKSLFAAVGPLNVSGAVRPVGAARRLCRGEANSQGAASGAEEAVAAAGILP
ncbi:hypothetical protein [Paenibacillus durus]|uniref:Uncharacterized protein n=1 Tax=Paenibacillus durus ATCC 35681 TaxID=1333534 RepID=A0A0F7CHH0_PAEDU|nr:hypothetical protein [Paenibacillus durus]AKG33735.1 hypothetical protein VK70_03330 [Paenibacillus durus ATCC 35681]